MLTKLTLLLIKTYQNALSLLFGSTCRFYPSCSHYTYQAITTHGLVKGVFLGLKRISTCHPWHEGGYDPVPGTDEPCENECSLEK